MKAVAKKPSQFDLTSKIPLRVQENQGQGSGYFAEIDGLREEFYPPEDLVLGARLSRRLRADQKWFEKLVRHAPTVGTFYEALLRDILHDIKPARLHVGTGFVFDLERHKPSSQLDVIVYDSTNRAALFQSREFSVVSSDILVSAAEIKKTLTLKDLRQCIQKTVNFRFGTHRFSPPGVQFINLFAYASRCKTRAVADCIKDELARHIDHFHAQTVSGAAVMLNALFITLPRVYFFDRGEFIETAIRRNTNGVQGYLIDVLVLRSAADEKDGLNEFLSAMLVEDNGSDLSPNLRAMPLRHAEYTLQIPRPLPLAMKISLRELAERIPKYRESLQELTICGQKPYAAFVPPDLDWSQVEDLETLCKLPGFGWKYVPVDTEKTE
jgi:hypothetical protein